MSTGSHDVIVVGAGNAALAAALAAQEQGARVLVLEKAPLHLRGGNSYFTGGYRFAYNGIEDIKAVIPEMTRQEEDRVDVGQYPEDKFYSDIMRVTEGLSDPELAQVLVGQSFPTMKWLHDRGMRFILLYNRQSFEVGGKHRFWGGLIVEAIGGGKGIVERNAIEIRYETKASRLLTDKMGDIVGVTVRGPGYGSPQATRDTGPATLYLELHIEVGNDQ